MANEKRLISVDNAISHYKALANIEWNKRVSPVSWADAYEEFIEYLEESPTVDAVEVVHGRWEKPSKYGMNHKFNHLGFVCSRCQKWNDNESNYCPNCGADMRERKDGK